MMKSFQALHVNIKQASERIVQSNAKAERLLRLVKDDTRGDQRGEHTGESHTYSAFPQQHPPRSTPDVREPAVASHSRQKSNVSSSAGTATTASTSSSTSVSTKELKRRIRHLEGKMRDMKRGMNETKDVNDLVFIPRQSLKHDVSRDIKHDSGYGSVKFGESPRASAANLDGNAGGY
jgi:hypothetical protein